jgi:hypothetical protein
MMADKGALELIGVMLFAATILVIGAGGFVVRNQLGVEAQLADNVQVAQLPVRLPALNAIMGAKLIK